MITRNQALWLLFILLLAAAGVTYFYKSRSVKGKSLADFAISDTSVVDKIFISDPNGNAVTLERIPGEFLWQLNGTYKARKDAVDLLLKTFLRLEVKAPVPSTAKENIIRNMAGNGRKCEVYVNGNIHKIYYIGGPTRDNYGTYAMLETPDEGRSTDPYIVQVSGFAGFLTPRFFTNEEDWRYTGIFRYPSLEFSKISLQYYPDSSGNFSISYNGGNNLSLFDGAGNIFSVFDTLAVKDYLLLFKKVHFENYNSGLNPAQEDSVFSLRPNVTITLVENNGVERKLTLWLKKSSKPIEDQGILLQWDPDHLYGSTDGEDLVLCQHFVFDPMLRPIQSFSRRDYPIVPAYLWQ
jgi:hypothetical protein